MYQHRFLVFTNKPCLLLIIGMPAGQRSCFRNSLCCIYLVFLFPLVFSFWFFFSLCSPLLTPLLCLVELTSIIAESSHYCQSCDRNSLLINAWHWTPTAARSSWSCWGCYGSFSPIYGAIEGHWTCMKLWLKLFLCVLSTSECHATVFLSLQEMWQKTRMHIFVLLLAWKSGLIIVYSCTPTVGDCWNNCEVMAASHCYPWCRWWSDSLWWHWLGYGHTFSSC